MIMCIVVDICDTLLLLLLLLDMFFTFPPAGPQTKGLVKSLDFPTQFTPTRGRPPPHGVYADDDDGDCHIG